MQEENHRTKARFQPPQQTQPPVPQAPKEPLKELAKVGRPIERSGSGPQQRSCTYSSVLYSRTSVQYTGLEGQYPYVFPWLQVSEKDEGASMKEWILRYAEQASEDEEEEEEEEEEGRGKAARNPELDQKFDPVTPDDVNLLCHLTFRHPLEMMREVNLGVSMCCRDVGVTGLCRMTGTCS